ncbi:hypothetical protein [Thioclava sp. GXIMD4215]|uniref:hypothetical protein n=1 Tax=Thioclava sp. GXIMD4215 TaxID=3131928 RepID=UPI003249EC57
MKKDDLYYFQRIWDAAEKLYNKKTEGKSWDEILAMTHALDAESGIEREVRIGIHLHEAFAIIRLLVDDMMPEDPDKIYDVVWVDRVSELMGKGELHHEKRTRAQLLKRLHWISSEEFGEDLDEWVDWMAAFEANPPPWGAR